MQQNFTDLLGTESSKKRKRRTSFTPQALEILNEAFDKSSQPGSPNIDINTLANKLNYDREVIRVWFCNKRQAFKNSQKKFKPINGVTTVGVVGGSAKENSSSPQSSISSSLSSSQVSAQNQLNAISQEESVNSIVINSSNTLNDSTTNHNNNNIENNLINENCMQKQIISLVDCSETLNGSHNTKENINIPINDTTS
jgi:POU domain transcription factor, class 6